MMGLAFRPRGCLGIQAGMVRGKMMLELEKCIEP